MNTYHQLPLTISHSEQQQSNLWFTFLPLGGVVRNEQQVKVQLNPQYRLLNVKVYPRGTRGKSVTSFNQKIHHVISLPKNIRMDQLQVKLTQRGDLVVVAPFKFPLQHQQDCKDSWKNCTCFLQQPQRWSEFQQGMNIPIKYTKGSRRNFRSFSPFSGLTSSSSSSESESTTTSSSESSSSTTSTSESESDFERLNMKKFNKRGRQTQLKSYGSSSDVNVKIQKFVHLLKTIFYPNTVECQFTPFHQGQSNISTFIVNIKPTVPFTSQSEVKCCVDPTRPNVLIVEMELSHNDRITGSFGVKYVRREIRIPQWLNLEQMMYCLKEQGYLQIKLPCYLNFTKGDFSHFNTSSVPYYFNYTLGDIEFNLKKRFGLGNKY